MARADQLSFDALRGRSPFFRAEHEAWRSALRLGAVLAAIVAAFALAVVSTAQAQSTEAWAAAPMLGQAQPAPACPPGQLSQG